MTANKYLFKAMDAYPYELEEAIEALEYALSYERSNITALCLMGRLQAEKLQHYEAAKEYYLEALAENPCAIEVFPYYINVLLWNEDFEDAENFITFALKVKGADKATLYVKKALLHEYQRNTKRP